MESTITPSITNGVTLTSRARDHVLAGAWRKGYQLLMTALPAEAAVHALEVLRGGQKVVGTANALALQPDEATEAMQSALDLNLAHCFRFAEAVFRPYAIAASHLAENAEFAKKFQQGTALHCANLRLRTAMHQARAPLEPASLMRALPLLLNPLSDLVVAAGDQAWPSVLCEKVNFEPPPWYEVTHEPRLAVARAQRGASLPVVGEPPKGAAGLFGERVAAPSPLLFARNTTVDVAQLAAAVAAYADSDAEYGWLELSGVDPVTRRQVALRVPHRAFVCCALHMAGASQLMPAYSPISPRGLKMPNDSPFHSDAWIGAGMRVDQAYSERVPEQRLFMRELGQLQRKLLGCSFVVLARGPDPAFAGKVVHDLNAAGADKVLVLETACPEAASAARACAGVIVETGSQLAHLVVVSREAAVPVIRIEGARSRFPSGRDVTVDFARGTAELLMPA